MVDRIRPTRLPLVPMSREVIAHHRRQRLRRISTLVTISWFAILASTLFVVDSADDEPAWTLWPMLGCVVGSLLAALHELWTSVRRRLLDRRVGRVTAGG